jgi:hypothetical protein
VTIEGDSAVSANIGGSHTFIAKASGGQGTIHYQWFFQPDANAKSFTQIEGATNSAYTLTKITANKAGAYYCEASDDNTVSDSGEVTLTVTVGAPAVGPMAILLMGAAIMFIALRSMSKKHINN